MPVIVESGTLKVHVAVGSFWGQGFVALGAMLPPNPQILLTAHVVPGFFDENSGPKRIFCPFTLIGPITDAPGFEIVVCEIDRQPMPREIDVVVDWAVVGP